MNAVLSTTRLPLDHVISGALFAAITLGSKDYVAHKNKEISTATLTKSLTKSAIQGGIAAGTAIAASNKIVMRNYIGATIYVAFGVATVMLAEKFLGGKK
ncbi:MAG: Cys/Met metabolism pyridoxal-phosphate-dependent enzyme [Campylobacter sp.]